MYVTISIQAYVDLRIDMILENLSRLIGQNGLSAAENPNRTSPLEFSCLQ